MRKMMEKSDKKEEEANRKEETNEKIGKKKL